MVKWGVELLKVPATQRFCHMTRLVLVAYGIHCVHFTFQFDFELKGILSLSQFVDHWFL